MYQFKFHRANGTADLAADRRKNRASFPSFFLPIVSSFFVLPFSPPSCYGNAQQNYRPRFTGRDAKGQNKNKTGPMYRWESRWDCIVMTRGEYRFPNFRRSAQNREERAHSSHVGNTRLSRRVGSRISNERMLATLDRYFVRCVPDDGNSNSSKSQRNTLDSKYKRSVVHRSRVHARAEMRGTPLISSELPGFFATTSLLSCFLS